MIGARTDAPAADPSVVTLGELFAMQPKYQRGTLAPGARFPTGMRPGRRRAQGLDLDSIGPYVPGDDPRFMDWRATARTGRAQMKRFIAESHLARMLIVDLRAQMYFATSGAPMAKTAVRAAARLAWEAFTLHEPIGMIVVPDPAVIAPRRGKAQILRILDRLVESYARWRGDRQAAGNAVLAECLESAAALLRKGDEIAILSDFGAPYDDLARTARQLEPVRRLRAVIIEDPIFREPVPPGQYPLQTATESQRQTALVSRGLAHRHGAIVTDLRERQHRTLARAGFIISELINDQGDGIARGT